MKSEEGSDQYHPRENIETVSEEQQKTKDEMNKRIKNFQEQSSFISVNSSIVPEN